MMKRDNVDSLGLRARLGKLAKLMRRFLSSMVSLGVVACGGERKAAPPPEPEVVQPTFKTERVACYIEPGAMGAGGRMDVGRRGLHECEHVLTNFLADNAARHLVSIVPIEFPLAPLAEGEKLELRQQGTQELIVTTADRGGWPKIGDLEVKGVPCVEVQEGKPTIPDPQACIKMITKFTTEKTVFWVSLSGPATELDPTKEDDVRPRTIWLLGIAQRRVSPRPAADPGSAASR